MLRKRLINKPREATLGLLTFFHILLSFFFICLS
jgi:hypothetical protein